MDKLLLAELLAVGPIRHLEDLKTMTFNQNTAGITLSPARWLQFNVFGYSFEKEKTRINGSLGLNFRTTQIRFQYYANDNQGNIELIQRFGGVYISVFGNIRNLTGPHRESFGQVDVSLPLSFRFGHKAHYVPPAYDEAREVPTGDITGRLVAEGQALENICVEIGGVQARTDQDGNFTIKALPVGSYRVHLLNLPIFYYYEDREIQVKGKKTVSLTIELIPKSKMEEK